MKQKIAITSDWHLEFGPRGYFLPSIDDESNTILVLAGDIVPAKVAPKYISFFEDVSDRFQDVLYVMGNHDHYGWDFLKTKERLEETFENLNITILDNDSIQIDDIHFVGTTLWSLIPDEDISICRSSMNDYHKISYGGGQFIPSDSNTAHKRAIEYLLREVDEYQKTVIITHHAPSTKSVAEMFLGNRLNCAFGTDLESLIKMLKPEYWIHGHMHNASDYMVGDTNVICNPKGYPNEIKEPFTLKVIEL